MFYRNLPWILFILGLIAFYAFEPPCTPESGHRIFGNDAINVYVCHNPSGYRSLHLSR